MKVKELIKVLERYDSEMEVVTNGRNSGGYVDSIYNVRIGTVRAFYGNDFQAVIIDGEDQVGMTD